MKMKMKTKTKRRIFRIRGGIAPHFYASDKERERYSFASPTIHLEGIKVVDCWICDSKGNVCPSLCNYPVPVFAGKLEEVSK